MTNVQAWVNSQYPTNKAKDEVEELYLSEPNLVGKLDLKKFPLFRSSTGRYSRGEVFISQYLDETKLSFKNQGDGLGLRIIKLQNAQQVFKQEFPRDGVCKGEVKSNSNRINWGKTRAEITQLHIARWELEGPLVIKDFPNLWTLSCNNNWLNSLTLINCPKIKNLNCSNNQLTQLPVGLNSSILTGLIISENQIKEVLNLNNFSNLTDLSFGNNQLTDLTIFSLLVNLKGLNISSNNFSGSLAPLAKLVNLESLRINNNNFTGSLEPMKGLTKLEELDLSNTQLDSGMEYLPTSLENWKFHCTDTPLVKELTYYKGDWKKWKANWEKDQKIIFLQQEHFLFSNQKEQIDYLQARIEELLTLNQQKSEQIFDLLSQLLPERELLGQLIKTHLELLKYKRYGSKNTDYSTKKMNYEWEIISSKKTLQNKLSNEQMNSLESILNNFEKLIEQEFELEAKLTEKSFLIESHQQTAKQLNANSSESSESRKRKRIIDAEEELQDQQLTKFKKLRSDSLNLVNLEDKLDELKEIMITSMNKITSMPQNNQGVIIHGNSNQFLNLRLSNNIMNVTTYEEENEARLSENDIDTANYEEVSEAIEAIGFLWNDSNENLLG